MAKAYTSGQLEKSFYHFEYHFEYHNAYWGSSKDYNPRRTLAPNQNKARLKKIKASKKERRRN